MPEREPLPRISVIIPARNAVMWIGDALDGLAAQEALDAFEVIVVDDGSTDGTAKVAQGHPLEPRVIHAHSAGPGAKRNAGAQCARADLLAFTDADCVPAHDWLAEGIRALEHADLVQGRVRPEPDRSIGPFDRTLAVETEYGLYETANVFVRKDRLLALGGFEDWWKDDDRPFGEDTLFAWRHRRLGGTTAFAPRAIVYHAVIAGDARRYLRERWRDGAFAHLVQRVPELREAFLWHRWFLNARSAAFDGALLAGTTAIARRRPVWLLGTLPWLNALRREVVSRSGRPDARVLATVALGDAVGFISLARGSIKARTPLF